MQHIPCSSIGSLLLCLQHAVRCKNKDSVLVAKAHAKLQDICSMPTGTKNGTNTARQQQGNGRSKTPMLQTSPQAKLVKEVKDTPTLIMEGLGSFLAASMAFLMAVRSVLPSLTCCTCQPRASNRAFTSSVKEISVWPSMEILQGTREDSAKATV